MPPRMMQITAKATNDTISLSLLAMRPNETRSAGDAGTACPLELMGAAAPAEMTSMSFTGMGISRCRAKKARPLRTAWAPLPPPCSLDVASKAALLSSPFATHDKNTDRFAGSAGRGGAW